MVIRSHGDVVIEQIYISKIVQKIVALQIDLMKSNFEQKQIKYK